MKAISILSAIVFAHAAFAQATDSTSAAVSTTDSSSVDAATSTSLVSSAAVAATSGSASTSAAVSSAATPSTTGTKTGTKSASGSKSHSTTSSANSATPSGSSIWEDGTQTLTSNDGNPFIPSGLSADCSSFLNKMNTDTAFASCLTPMLNTLSSFTTSGSASSSAVSKTLDTLCATTSCTQSTMRSKLTDFNNACSGDFASSKVVAANYDMMYALIPMKSAMCSKDPDTQKYCLLSIGSSSSNTKRSASNVMYARDHLVSTYVKRGASQTFFAPNADVFGNSGLMFMFMSANMGEADLCTSCTKAVMSKYIAWEAGTPYAMGVAMSPMLGGQVGLYKAIQNTCPADFMSAIANAGGNTASSTSAASPVAAGSALTALAGALAALVALV